MKLGEQLSNEPAIVKDALETLRGFGFKASALDDHLFDNAKNLVHLNNQFYNEIVGYKKLIEDLISSESRLKLELERLKGQ